MFRTAESFGAARLVLSPLCADPRHPRALRSARGCVDVLPWKRASLEDAVAANSAGGVFALEIGGVPIERFVFPRRGLLLVGSEELGLSPEALARADASLGRLTIPCFGAKASLNVSVAFGIALHAWAASLNQ
jgi:TrmH family RNA methyltransferase